MSNTSNRIRLGMLGGGQGALIGGVHRFAARLDDRYELVAGVFAPEAGVNQASAEALGVPQTRCYTDYEAMIAAEAARDDGVQVVAIVTPNHLHFPMALACIQAGLHVICEKPMTVSDEQAEALAEAVEEMGVHFVLMHNYCGYPLIQHARQLVAEGTLGAVRTVQVEYVQEWLSQQPEADNKQAAWRLDPSKAGAAGCLGDIGTHAYHLASFITGLKLSEVSADLSSMVAGRTLDDNVHALLRFEGGAKGMLWASQTAPGFENALRIRVIGEQASIEWAQESPNELWLMPLNAPAQRVTRRDDFVSAHVAEGMRIPPGHPEGYLEAFANLYKALADTIQQNRHADWVPDVHAGVEGLRFITASLNSSQSGGTWTPMAAGRSTDGGAVS